MSVSSQSTATYRATPSWVVYPVVALCFLVGLGGINDVPGHVHGVVASVIVAVLIALGGFVSPVALLLLSRGIGVRVSDAGIVSIGLNDAHVICWQDIDRFYAHDDAGAWAVRVYVELTDGTHLRLYSLSARPWQRKRVERLCRALQSEQLSRSGRVGHSPSAAFDAPLGWRRRVHRLDSRQHPTARRP